jgi:hypothetical protein
LTTAKLKQFSFNLANRTLSIAPVRIRHVHPALGRSGKFKHWQIQTPPTLNRQNLSDHAALFATSPNQTPHTGNCQYHTVHEDLAKSDGTGPAPNVLKLQH